ncbi:DUF169 domain-containing protein [Chloroflexota bacterium]
MAKDWKGLSKRLVSHVGLRTKPVGLKFFKRADELKNIKGIERPAFKRTICQFIGSARFLGQAWGATTEDQLCPGGALCVGVSSDIPEAYISGTMYSESWKIATTEVGRLLAEGQPKNKDKFEAFAIMPLDGVRGADQITFEPDLVIIYGEPGSIGLLILPICAALGIPAFEGRVLGETAVCADGIAACWNTGEPKFFLPCIGDRAFGGTLPSEVAIVLPADILNEAIVSNCEKFSFPLNQTLRAPLGASSKIMKSFRAQGKSTAAGLKKGTPVIPDEES